MDLYCSMVCSYVLVRSSLPGNIEIHPKFLWLIDITVLSPCFESGNSKVPSMDIAWKGMVGVRSTAGLPRSDVVEFS